MSYRPIVEALLESMDACDATRSNESTPYQKRRSQARHRRDLRIVLCLMASIMLFFVSPFILAAVFG